TPNPSFASSALVSSTARTYPNPTVIPIPYCVVCSTIRRLHELATHQTVIAGERGRNRRAGVAGGRISAAVVREPPIPSGTLADCSAFGGAQPWGNRRPRSSQRRVSHAPHPVDAIRDL